MPPASPQSKPLEQLAEAPFNDAQADIILRSSDGVHFRVFKTVLSLASLTFADMFSIPLPPTRKGHDEVQVVPLSEHSTSLHIALRHIYPMRRSLPPKADPLFYASILAEFARKYQVEALYHSVMGYLMYSVKRDPVGVYAIAVTYGYNEAGAKAARSCLNLPFSDLQSPYVRYATAEDFLELLRYHVACGEVASTLASLDRSWLSSPVRLKKGLTDFLRGSGQVICQSCTTLDFISGGPDSIIMTEDDDKGIFRKSFRPTVCVGLLASFLPRPCTSPDSRSSYCTRLCTEAQ